MTRDEVIGATARQVAACSEKLDEALVMGKPSEAEQYANCLLLAAQAYATVVAAEEADDEDDDE